VDDALKVFGEIIELTGAFGIEINQQKTILICA